MLKANIAIHPNGTTVAFGERLNVGCYEHSRPSSDAKSPDPRLVSFVWSFIHIHNVLQRQDCALDVDVSCVNGGGSCQSSTVRSSKLNESFTRKPETGSKTEENGHSLSQRPTSNYGLQGGADAILFVGPDGCSNRYARRTSFPCVIIDFCAFPQTEPAPYFLIQTPLVCWIILIYKLEICLRGYWSASWSSKNLPSLIVSQLPGVHLQQQTAKYRCSSVDLFDYTNSTTAVPGLGSEGQTPHLKIARNFQQVLGPCFTFEESCL